MAFRPLTPRVSSRGSRPFVARATWLVRAGWRAHRAFQSHRDIRARSFELLSFACPAIHSSGQSCIITGLRWVIETGRSRISASAPKSELATGRVRPTGGLDGALRPRNPMSEGSDHLAAAALARARSLQAARNAFISARSTTIRAPTPLYFFVTPVIVRLTAPWWTRP